MQYLEHKAIAEAKKANAFVLSDNKQIPKAPNLPEHQQDSMNEFFEDVKFLASFIGCNIFEVSQPKEEHLFYTKGRGCNAKGFYSSDGFTVLKGSTVAKNNGSRLFNWKEKREKMLQDYTSTENGILVLTSDKTFSSPSTAADFCIGSSNNGWLVWKDKEEIHWTQFIENSWINNISVGGKYGNYQSTRLHRPHRVERMAEGQP